MLLIGTDEAGYGPNLGPLVVSATAWSLSKTIDLGAVGAVLRHRGIDIADSKRLYHGGGSLRALELGVWTVFLAADKTSVSLEMDRVDPCWQRDFFNEPVMDINRQMRELAETFRQFVGLCGIKLLRNRSLILGAAGFNRRLDVCGSKGTLLSETTLELVRDLLAEMPEYQLKKAVVLCDKHGGRNRYLDVLNQFFPDVPFQVVEESRPLSTYRSKNLEFRFQSKGESQLPVALASMFSKYLREVCMLSFNTFWRSHLPGLKPTAGYPVDAKRFKADIAEVQAALGLPDDLIWRKK